MSLSLLVPSVDTFLRDDFGVRHVHHEASALPDSFNEFFPVSAVDEVLGNTGLRFTSIKLAKEGRELPLAKFGTVDSGDPPGSPSLVDTDFVRRALASGHTLILRSLHRYHPGLRAFAHTLSGELGHPIRINAFITPPHSAGTDLHYDTHDVFIKQISGEKIWELRTAPIPHPASSQAWFDLPSSRRVELRDRTQPLGETVLRCGDTLYLPAGTMHAPRTEDAQSVHLTVAVPKVTRHDLVRHFIATAVDDVWFRADARLDELADDPETVRTLLRDAVERLLKTVGEVTVPDLLWDTKEEAFAELTPEPVSIILPAGREKVAYRLRSGVLFSATLGEETLVLRVRKKLARLPRAVMPVLERLRQGEVVDATSKVDGLDEEQLADTLKTLYDLGLTAPAPHGG